MTNKVCTISVIAIDNHPDTPAISSYICEHNIVPPCWSNYHFALPFKGEDTGTDGLPIYGCDTELGWALDTNGIGVWHNLKVKGRSFNTKVFLDAVNNYLVVIVTNLDAMSSDCDAFERRIGEWYKDKLVDTGMEPESIRVITSTQYDPPKLTPAEKAFDALRSPGEVNKLVQKAIRNELGKECTITAQSLGDMDTDLYHVNHVNKVEYHHKNFIITFASERGSKSVIVCPESEPQNTTRLSDISMLKPTLDDFFDYEEQIKEIFGEGKIKITYVQGFDETDGNRKVYYCEYMGEAVAIHVDFPTGKWHAHVAPPEDEDDTANNFTNESDAGSPSIETEVTRIITERHDKAKGKKKAAKAKAKKAPRSVEERLDQAEADIRKLKKLIK